MLMSLSSVGTGSPPSSGIRRSMISTRPPPAIDRRQLRRISIAARVVPVVQHVREQVAVRARRDALRRSLRRAPRSDRRASAASRTASARAATVGGLEQHTVQVGVSAQDLDEQRAVAAADVDDGAGVLRSRSSSATLGANAAVRSDIARIECRRRCSGCSARNSKMPVSERDLKSGLAGPDGLAGCARTGERRRAPQGSVAHERIPAGTSERRRSPSAVRRNDAALVLFEHAERREQAQHAIQRRLVRAGRLGQLFHARRGTVGEQIGDPELSHRVQAARDVDPPDQVAAAAPRQRARTRWRPTAAGAPRQRRGKWLVV